MPRQGQSVESCIITKLYMEEGSEVKEGDLLFAYETDKASFEYESEQDGILLKWLFSEGDEVPVLETVCIVGEEGEHVDDERRSGISPRAMRMAEEKGIDISKIKGSGPGGRIIVRDLEGAEKTEKVVSTPADTDEYSDEPLTYIRKIIANSMFRSLQNSAQLTHHLGADARKLLATRDKIKERKGNKGYVNITINDLVCFATIKALAKHPRVNSHLHGETMRLFRNVNLGIAVDTDRGLMVPVIKKADRLSIEALSKEAENLSARCRSGTIDPDILRPEAGSFTVSNLGNYGVEMFTPIINLPQTAILGVNAIVPRPAELGDGVYGFVPYIGLSLTYDHRALDGGEATRFLKQVAEEIENIKIK
ncbi:MAG: dihydrolipoamide acetyltransferase family protein [Bacteroidota bacterium]|nr:dihydrolipoamide acetyltransferase family protein [Bacteroidota bacterium]